MRRRLLFLFALLALYSNAQSQQADSIILNNAVLYYYTYGSGEPIILLSGGPGSGSHQIDNVAMELGKKYKAILFDQRGTGRSWTKPFDTTTINLGQAVEDLEHLRKHLHIDKLNLYGRSWGGMLASAYIARYPDRVKLFVSVNGGELDNTLSTTVDENEEAKHQKNDSVAYKYWKGYADEAKATHELRKLSVSDKVYDTTKLLSNLPTLSTSIGGSRSALAAGRRRPAKDVKGHNFTLVKMKAIGDGVLFAVRDAVRNISNNGYDLLFEMPCGTSRTTAMTGARCTYKIRQLFKSCRICPHPA